jgi:peroxiredoxin Q/BCP
MNHFLIASLVAALLQDTPKIEKGEKAPDFVAKNQEGKEIKLTDFKDKKPVLLAFYPKDATKG